MEGVSGWGGADGRVGVGCKAGEVVAVEGKASPLKG